MTQLYVPAKHIVAASAWVTNDAGQVLLVKTKRGWDLPGGQVEEGEDIIAGCAREVLEESGIVAEVGALSGVYSNLTKVIVVFQFFATAIGGELQTSIETSEVGWYTPEEALEMITHPVIYLRATDCINAKDTSRPVYRAYTMNTFNLVRSGDV